MVAAISYGEDIREHPCGVPTPDHGEADETASQWVVGDTGSRGRATGGEYTVGSTYMGLRQEMSAQFVDLRPILKVCVWETVYEGGGRKR